MSGEALDRLLAGFAHDLNGRATALRGITILATEEPTPDEWAPLLESEAERLERLAAGLSALRLDPPEPAALPELLRQAARTLAAVHIELRCERPPADHELGVRVSRGQFIRALAVLAFELVPAHTAGVLHARVVRTGAEVSVEVWAEGATSPPDVPVSLPGARLAPIPRGYRLSLPALEP